MILIVCFLNYSLVNSHPFDYKSPIFTYCKISSHVNHKYIIICIPQNIQIRQYPYTFKYYYKCK